MRSHLSCASEPAWPCWLPLSSPAGLAEIDITRSTVAWVALESLSDQLSSVPVSPPAKSCTKSFHVPEDSSAFADATARSTTLRLSVPLPVRLCKTNCAPEGAINVTFRSPMKVCVI